MQYKNLAPSKKIEHYEWNTKAHLGSGSYGKVYFGKDTKNDKHVAIKVIEMSTLEDKYLMESLNNEVSLMKNLKHTNVVQLLDLLFTKNNVYIIQEFCNGGDLRNYMSKKKGVITEIEASKILLDIINGFSELHKSGIIHRDLKPENILLNDDVFKLGDFGFAKHVDNYQSQLLTSLVGTPLYMSPQILKTEKYTTKSDVWSLGLIYYEMLFGKTPWPAKSQYQLITNIYKMPLKFPYNINLSERSEKFLKGCLQLEEKDRFSWNDVFNSEIFTELSGSPKHQQPAKQVSLQHNNSQMDNRARILIQKLQGVIVKNKVNIEKLFTTLDQNKSKSIYLSEFKSLIKCLDKNVTEDEIEHIFNIFDDDGNKELSFDEFRKQLIETDYSNYTLYKDPFLEERAERILANLRELIRKGNYKVESLFEIFDKQKKNALNFEEFESMLVYVDKEITSKEIEYVFRKFDEDNNNSIEFEEFNRAIILKRGSLSQENSIIAKLDQKAQKIIEGLKDVISLNHLNLKKMFKKFEKSTNESLTRKEFHELIKNIDETARDEEIDYLFSKVDADGDKTISYGEFKKFVL